MVGAGEAAARTEAAATASACFLRRPVSVSQVIEHTSQDCLTLPLGELLTEGEAVSGEDKDAGLVAARKGVRQSNGRTFAGASQQQKRRKGRRGRVPALGHSADTLGL